MYRGLSEGMGMKAFARLDGLWENAESAIPYGGPGPARKKKELYREAGGESSEQKCRCGKAIEGTTHIVGECEMYK